MRQAAAGLGDGKPGGTRTRHWIVAVLAGASLIVLTSVAVVVLAAGGFDALPPAAPLLLAVGTAALAAAFVLAWIRRGRLAALPLVVLAAILGVIGVLPRGAAPESVSGLGALTGFLIAPLVCATTFRKAAGFTAAFMASVAVPAIFVVSVIVDGPVLQGAGRTIDAIDAATVPLWLAIVAANLTLRAWPRIPVEKAGSANRRYA